MAIATAQKTALKKGFNIQRKPQDTSIKNNKNVRVSNLSCIRIPVGRCEIYGVAWDARSNGDYTAVRLASHLSVLCSCNDC